jgi:hypothetical protein
VVVSNLSVIQAAGLVESTTCPIILILNQYAHYGKGTTVHSKGQLGKLGMMVNDCSRELGGDQNIITPCDKIIHLSYHDGLPKMDMCPPTEDEMASYPHVILTSEMEWDPTILDNEFGPNDMPSSATTTNLPDSHLNDYGELNRDHANYVHHCCIRANGAAVNRNEPDYTRLQPYLGWTSLDRVKQMLKNTTQFYRASIRQPF